MASKLVSSLAIVLLAALSAAWIQEEEGEWIGERLCQSVSDCSDYEGAVTACAVRHYDLDGDGVCEETCEKCSPLGNNNEAVYTCEEFEEAECFVVAAGWQCQGFWLVAPCLKGVCTGLWSPTTEDCTFTAPDCK